MRRKRDSKGRFLKAGAHRATHSRTSKRRTHRRIVYAGAAKRAVLFNPRRRKARRARRVYASNPRRARRHYRRNPSFGGIFSMGMLKLAAYTGAGFLGTPLVAGFVMGYLPITDATTRKWAAYAVDVGAAWGLSFAADKIGGKEAARAVLVGGLAYVAVSLVRDFLPQLTGSATPALSAYPGMRSQPLLGTYQPSGMGSAVTSRTADRLNPANRF